MATDELETVSDASLIYTVDSFSNGIAFGLHRAGCEQDVRAACELKLGEEGQVTRLRSRYTLTRENPLWELERVLMRLSRQGVLSSSHLYFGTSTDPFFPFEGKFDVSMKFLQLFERYTPGFLTIQTRSPLVVIAMPVLQRLKNRVAVTIAIETPHDEAVRRYTPSFPRVEERLRAATALRRFGIEITLQVAPVLPYGDWKNDAVAFAELLDAHADYIALRSLTDGAVQTERRLKHSEVAKRLAADRKFHWLRPDSAQPLYNALEKRCPAKVQAPSRSLKQRQMNIFAA